MAGPAAPDWEDILNAYLEGRGLRADAEDLLMRLHLTAQDREHVERSLRLADEVAAAMRPIQPPDGMAERLARTLGACPAPARMPTRWDLDGGPAADDDDPTEEDLLNAAIDGRVSFEQLYDARAAGQLSESGREAIEDLETIAAGVADVSLPMSGAAPSGLEARLVDRLRAHMDSDEGDVDQRVVNRLLTRRTHTRGAQIVLPDVLAAGEDPDDAE
jgi:hypothetical protein